MNSMNTQAQHAPHDDVSCCSSCLPLNLHRGHLSFFSRRHHFIGVYCTSTTPTPTPTQTSSRGSSPTRPTRAISCSYSYGKQNDTPTLSRRSSRVCRRGCRCPSRCRRRGTRAYRILMIVAHKKVERRILYLGLSIFSGTVLSAQISQVESTACLIETPSHTELFLSHLKIFILTAIVCDVV